MLYSPVGVFVDQVIKRLRTHNSRLLADRVDSGPFAPLSSSSSKQQTVPAVPAATPVRPSPASTPATGASPALPSLLSLEGHDDSDVGTSGSSSSSGLRRTSSSAGTAAAAAAAQKRRLLDLRYTTAILRVEPSRLDFDSQPQAKVICSIELGGMDLVLTSQTSVDTGRAFAAAADLTTTTGNGTVPIAPSSLLSTFTFNVQLPDTRMRLFHAFSMVEKGGDFMRAEQKGLRLLLVHTPTILLVNNSLKRSATAAATTLIPQLNKSSWLLSDVAPDEYTLVIEASVQNVQLDVNIRQLADFTAFMRVWTPSSAAATSGGPHSSSTSPLSRAQVIIKKRAQRRQAYVNKATQQYEDNEGAGNSDDDDDNDDDDDDDEGGRGSTSSDDDASPLSELVAVAAAGHRSVAAPFAKPTTVPAPKASTTIPAASSSTTATPTTKNTTTATQAAAAAAATTTNNPKPVGTEETAPLLPYAMILVLVRVHEVTVSGDLGHAIGKVTASLASTTLSVNRLPPLREVFRSSRGRAPFARVLTMDLTTPTVVLTAEGRLDGSLVVQSLSVHGSAASKFLLRKAPATMTASVPINTMQLTMRRLETHLKYNMQRILWVEVDPIVVTVRDTWRKAISTDVAAACWLIDVRIEVVFTGITLQLSRDTVPSFLKMVERLTDLTGERHVHTYHPSAPTSASATSASSSSAAAAASYRRQQNKTGSARLSPIPRLDVATTATASAIDDDRLSEASFTSSTHTAGVFAPSAAATATADATLLSADERFAQFASWLRSPTHRVSVSADIRGTNLQLMLFKFSLLDPDGAVVTMESVAMEFSLNSADSDEIGEVPPRKHNEEEEEEEEEEGDMAQGALKLINADAKTHDRTRHTLCHRELTITVGVTSVQKASFAKSGTAAAAAAAATVHLPRKTTTSVRLIPMEDIAIVTRARPIFTLPSSIFNMESWQSTVAPTIAYTFLTDFDGTVDISLNVAQYQYDG